MYVNWCSHSAVGNGFLPRQLGDMLIIHVYVNHSCLIHANHSVVQECLHCCKSDQLSLWGNANLGVSPHMPKFITVAEVHARNVTLALFLVFLPFL